MNHSVPPTPAAPGGLVLDLLYVYAIVEHLQLLTPSPEHAALLRKLRPLRNRLAHGEDLDPDELDPELMKLVSVLHQVGQSSLGTTAARAVRAQMSPTAAADVLARAAAIEQAARCKALVAEAQSVASESTDWTGAHSRLQEIRDELTSLDTRSLKDTGRLWQRVEQAAATLAQRHEHALEQTRSTPDGGFLGSIIPPEMRTLLGVDVIDSARTAPHLRPQVPVVLETLLSAGMDAVGISRDDAVDAQYTGDGWLYAFPIGLLGRVVDLGRTLDGIVTEHNRWNKLELRLRLAVDAGPLPDTQGFHAANISRARLLEAPAFKLLARECMAARADGSMSTAMIMSDIVYRTVFDGAYAKVARVIDFASLAVTNKEFNARAWVAVPGFDARTLAEMAEQDGTAASAPVEESEPTHGGRVKNTIKTNSGHAVAAHTINGGIVTSRDPR
jgi:hypothetical protein